MEDIQSPSLDQFYGSPRGEHFWPIADSKVSVLLLDPSWHPGVTAVKTEIDETSPANT